MGVGGLHAHVARSHRDDGAGSKEGAGGLAAAALVARDSISPSQSEGSDGSCPQGPHNSRLKTRNSTRASHAILRLLKEKSQ